jgi:hypothetical protein
VLFVTGIGTLRVPLRLTPVRTTLELEGRVVRAVREARVAAVDDGTDAGLAGTRWSLGTATCGKWAAGSDRVGIATGFGGASISARIASPIVAAYGSANAVTHAIANQNRMRRVPRPLMPNVPEVPKPCAPAAAGLRRLYTSTHPC